MGMIQLVGADALIGPKMIFERGVEGAAPYVVNL